jgi:hypothetical protein
MLQPTLVSSNHQGTHRDLTQLQVRMAWDVERFSSHTRTLKQGEGIENRARNELVRLSKYFLLPDQQQDLKEPGTILDRDGRIMVWFLPGILSKKRVVSCPSHFLANFLSS